MKTSIHKLAILASVSLTAPCLVTSCGAPDPHVQGEMERNILSAQENRGPGNTTGPQQAQGSKNWGHGGY